MTDQVTAAAPEVDTEQAAAAAPGVDTEQVAADGPKVDAEPEVDTEPTETEPTDAEPTDTEPIETDSRSEEGAAGDPRADQAGQQAGPTPLQRLEREGEVAADFLETLLDIADIDGDIDVDVEGDRAAIAIVDSEEGQVPRRLVGDHAKVLEALQELTRLAVQSATGERSRLMLDVGGYRADRRRSLVVIAQAAIAQVKDSGEATTLDPMTAFERKVVHDEVLAAGLSSESEGAEPHRCVVVIPA